MRERFGEPGQGVRLKLRAREEQHGPRIEPAEIAPVEKAQAAKQNQGIGDAEADQPFVPGQTDQIEVEVGPEKVLAAPSRDPAAAGRDEADQAHGLGLPPGRQEERRTDEQSQKQQVAQGRQRIAGGGRLHASGSG